MAPRDHLDLTPANILDFAKKYSMYPGNAAAGYLPKNETQLTGKFKGFRHTLVDNTQDVARITVTRNQQAGLGMARGADFMVTPSLTATAGTPSFFLPWDKRGAAVEMTIPPFPAVGGNAVTNPPIFFTAVLSGCSIVFKGTQAKPTIFHCGTGGGEEGTPTQGDSNQFFRSMLREIRNQGLGRSNYNVGSQVLSTDYMKTNIGGGAAPLHETQFKSKLTNHYQGTFYIENVSMWGIVFGFRTGVNWEFYLQENATIIYREVDEIIGYFARQAMLQKKPQSFDISQLTPDMITQAGNNIQMIVRSRPAVVTRVFPGGANAQVMSRWKTLRV